MLGCTFSLSSAHCMGGRFWASLRRTKAWYLHTRRTTSNNLGSGFGTSCLPLPAWLSQHSCEKAPPWWSWTSLVSLEDIIPIQLNTPPLPPCLPAHTKRERHRHLLPRWGGGGRDRDALCGDTPRHFLSLTDINSVGELLLLLLLILIIIHSIFILLIIFVYVLRCAW